MKDMKATFDDAIESEDGQFFVELSILALTCACISATLWHVM